jgi:DUF438 domain-containing protein
VLEPRRRAGIGGFIFSYIFKNVIKGSGASISNDDEAASGHIHKVYKRNGDEAYKIQMYAEAIYWYSKAIQEINGNIPIWNNR